MESCGGPDVARGTPIDVHWPIPMLNYSQRCGSADMVCLKAYTLNTKKRREENGMHRMVVQQN